MGLANDKRCPYNNKAIFMATTPLERSQPHHAVPVNTDRSQQQITAAAAAAMPTLAPLGATLMALTPADHHADHHAADHAAIHAADSSWMMTSREDGRSHGAWRC